ncbi:MAG: hypothetical protein R3B40_05800 [Polyangiales bacterium]|nr:hypothetical protein [Myxococcales bacterium]MCB9657450.1 hypothetical protein [Sandaracinaceae bacterium]
MYRSRSRGCWAWTLWLVAFGGLLVGCGGSERDSASTSAGTGATPRPYTAGAEEEASESPGIADMPYLPMRLGSTTARFQRVYRLVLLASESPLVPVPDGASRAAVEVWASDVLVPWIELRSDILASCRIELRALRAGELEEHLIAAALVGYLYEDTALQLRGVRIPTPGNPRADVRAAPPARIEFLLEQARRAFERCLLAGVGELEVASYRQYCEEAVARLGPSSLEYETPSSDEDEAEDAEFDP